MKRRSTRNFIDRIDKIFQDEGRNENDSFPIILLNPVNLV